MNFYLILQFSEKNIISHKFKFKKKDFKITIKVTKNNSLIGLAEFLIPSQTIQNHETIFQKICTVAMTENTKRTIFNSNNPSNNIKINVEANLSYNNEIEKEKKDVKNHTKNFSPSNPFLSSISFL